jgi:hypothetical protein
MGKQFLNHGTLREVISKLESLTEEDYICAIDKPNWTENSAAYVLRIPEFTDLRTVGQISDYFLEVFTAHDAMDDWSALRLGRKPSLDETVEALIYFAKHDANIPLDIRP